MKIYVTFTGISSGRYYFKVFDDLRGAVIFKQCLETYIALGYGSYMDLKISKKINKDSVNFNCDLCLFYERVKNVKARGYV